MPVQLQGGALAPGAPQPQPAGWRDHAVHFYEDDDSLLRVVAAFAGEPLQGGGAVIAIATAPHLRDLEAALDGDGLDVDALVRSGKLVTADAEEALSEFMVGDAPDPIRFRDVVEPLVVRARAACGGGLLRAYGEMVNVLWARGNAAGTERLEALWTELLEARRFSLLCSYRLGAFAAHEHQDGFRTLAAHHASVLPSRSWLELGPDERLRRVAELEQRALALEAEVERRRRAEQERARLYDAERTARAEAALLYRVTDAANRAETLEQVYAAALDGIAGALGVDRAAILLLDSDGVMRFKAWRGLGDPYRAAVEGHGPWRPDDPVPAPILVDDVAKDARVAGLRAVLAREGIGAAGFFPLCSGGRLLGNFMVYHRRAHAFTDAERRLATAIADQIALAVDRKLAALERERLLGIVGHDLRNPLSAIVMSTAALLKREAPGDAGAKPLHRIVASARRMERIIRHLLEFAQARQGRGIPVHAVPANLGEIARSVLDELEAANPDRRLELEVEGTLAGEWDPDLLAEVLSNLVANALQHGAGGPVSVRVRGAGAEVHAEVHNHGPAIPPDLLPHLFDPFRRGGAEPSRSGSVGLGLFITREIVRAHRGDIEVRSSDGDGTTVALRLPRTLRG